MKFYTHKTNLVERTKLLEGIVCQSITFTNKLGSIFENVSKKLDALNKYQARFYRININTQTEDSTNDNYIKSLYLTPVSNDITLVSPLSIGNHFCQILNGELGTGDQPYQTTKSIVSVSIDGVIKNYSNNETTTFSNFKNLILSYTITVVGGELSGLGMQDVKWIYEFTYSVARYENRHPTKPWTITSAINRILDLAEPIYKDEEARFTLNPIQAEKWNNTPLPNTTMTQCTLREQLQHIGNYVHAQVRLGGYYDGRYRENMIFFDEYGGTEESTLQGKPYSTNQIKHSINEYNTKIETNAQNIVNSIDYADGVITSPDSKNYKTIRTESVNIRLSESNCIIETEFPIYDIVSVKVRAYKPEDEYDGYYDFGELDITPFIFEQHEYNSVLSSYGGAYPYSKEYALYYTQGKKNINGLFVKAKKEVGGIFGDYFVAYSIVNILKSVAPDGDWQDYVTLYFPYLAFQVTYIPFFETKYSHTDGYILGQERKLPYSKIYNQSENVIEARFYGENIKGVAQRLGNKEATRTYILGSINGVPKVGTILDGYYISQVITEYMPFSIRCTVGLTENFNRLSQNVGINSHKRVSEVSEREAYDRNILIKEYICIGSNESLPLKNDVCQRRTQQSTIYMLTGENPDGIFNTEYFDVQSMAVSMFYSKNDTAYAFASVKSPVVSSAFGNCITFSWRMADNYSAGTSITKLNDGFWQQDVPYCDYYGRAYYMRFNLHNYLDAIGSSGKESALTVAITDGDQTYDGEIIGNDKLYKLRKDSREIIKMNLAIEYVTNRQDLVICSGMAYCNILVSSAKKGKVPKVYFFADKTRAFDNIHGRTAKSEQTLFANGDNGVYFSIPNVVFESWVIAYPVESEQRTVYDEDTGKVETYTEYSGGEVLMACNNSDLYYEEIRKSNEYLYINTYSDRIKDYESV